MENNSAILSQTSLTKRAVKTAAGISYLTRLLALWAASGASEDEERIIPVGGQAVIEGVLMKGPQHWGLAVREPSGKIWTKAWLGSEWLKKKPWTIPVLRGFASMVEMLRIGMRALSLSAERALGEDDSFTWKELAVSIFFAVLMVAGLFIALPVWISDKLTTFFGASYVLKNVLEGVARASVFIGYVVIVGFLKDIRRVFSYHGAEHKTINAYETRAPLTVESVALCSRIHRRCGTSFMLVVVAVSILVFSFFGGGPVWQRAAARIILLPLVVGLSYEIIKGAAKSDTWGKALIWPALSLQYVTTREPDGTMLEVAIKSLEVALDPSADLSSLDQSDEVKQDGAVE